MNVELRGLLRVWNEHWANYEYMGAASHVRAGWIYHDEGDLANGRDSRVARLSRNGLTDVLQEYSWLDNEIPSFLDPARFPRHVTHPNPDPRSRSSADTGRNCGRPTGQDEPRQHNHGTGGRRGRGEACSRQRPHRPSRTNEYQLLRLALYDVVRVISNTCAIFGSMMRRHA
jgi:hypothetical protein